jgi:hypothetical protein
MTMGTGSDEGLWAGKRKATSRTRSVWVEVESWVLPRDSLHSILKRY